MSEITSTAPQSRGPTDHNVREQILEAAEEHFSRYGYEKTTVSDLAKAIGFSKAYIYKFFDSKQAIGEAICSKTTPTSSRRRRRNYRTWCCAAWLPSFCDVTIDNISH